MREREREADIERQRERKREREREKERARERERERERERLFVFVLMPRYQDKFGTGKYSRKVAFAESCFSFHCICLVVNLVFESTLCYPPPSVHMFYVSCPKTGA